MPQYDVRLSDGRTVRVNAPEGATQEQIGALAFQTGASRESRVDLLRQDAERRRRIAEEQLAANRRRRAVEETGVLGQLVRGVGAGAVGMTGTALQGAAELLPNEYEEPVQEGIAGLVDYLTPEYLVREGEGSTAQQIAATFGQALGSTAPLIAAGAVGGLPAAAALGAGAGAGEAGQRARRAGASDEEQMLAVLQGTGVGLTEAGPLGAVSRLFGPAAKAASIIAPKLDPGWRAKAKAAYDYTVRRAGPAAAEEAAQESIASSLQNAIEKGYNPEQDIFDAGVFEEGAYGAGVGATIQALADLAIRGRNRRIISEAYAEDEARDIRSAEEARRAAELQEAEGIAAAEGEDYLDSLVGQFRDQAAREEAMRTGAADMLRRGTTAPAAPETVPEIPEPQPNETFEEYRARVEQQMRAGAQDVMLRDEVLAANELADIRAQERLGEEQLDLFPIDLEQTRRRLGPRPTTPEQEQVSFGDLGESLDEAAPQQLDILDEIELRTLLEQEEAAAQAAEQAAEQARARAEQTRLASDIETTDARVRDAEAARSRAARLRILQDVIETTPTRQTDTLTKAFQRALQERGIQRAPLPAERRLIKRAIDFQRAQPVDEGPVPSSADLAALESAVPERRTSVPESAAGTPEEQLGLDLGPLPERAEEAPAGPRPVRSLEEALEGRRPLPPQRLTPARLSELGVPEAREVRPGRAPTPGTALRAAVEGKDINEPGVQDALAEFVRASKGQQVATNIARILNATPEAQAEMFPAPAEARRRDRPVEPVVVPEAVTPEEGAPTADAGQPQQTEAAPEAQSGSKSAAEPEQEAPPASERREQAPRELTEEELEAEGPRQTLGLDEIRRVDMEEAFRRARAPQPATETDTPAAAGMSPADAARAQAKARFYIARRLAVRGTILENLQTPTESYDPFNRGDYVAISELVEGPVEDTTLSGDAKKQRDAARRYFLRYPTPQMAMRAVAYEIAAGEKNFSRPESSDLIIALREETGGVHAGRAFEWMKQNLNAATQRFLEAELSLQQSRVSAMEDLSTDFDRVTAAREAEAEAREKARAKAIREANKRRRTAEQEDIELVDDMLDTLQELDKNLRVASNTPLHPAAELELLNGDLQGAVDTVATTNANPFIRQIAKRLSQYIGNTTLELVDGLTDTVSGKPIAGRFSPRENKIYLDRTRGVNTHTVLHELVHAAVSAALARPSSPAAKQLLRLYNELRPRLSGTYAAIDVDEFVAEVLSNPDLQAELARIALTPDIMGRLVEGKVPKDGFTFWDYFKNTIGNAVRRIMGRAPVRLGQSVTDVVSQLTDSIMAPAPEYRGGADLALAISASDITNKIADGVVAAHRRTPEKTQAATQAFADRFADFVRFGGAGTGERVALGFMPMTAVTDLADSERYRFGQPARALERAVMEKEGFVTQQRQFIDAVSEKVVKWAGKAGKDNYDTLNRFIMDATMANVDGTKSRDTYKGDAEKLAEWDRQQPIIDKLRKNGGLEQFTDLRDTYARIRQELLNALELRVVSSVEGVDRAQAQTLAKRFIEDLANKGQIDPYFPLYREGQFWLRYDAGESNLDYGYEAFETNQARERRMQELQAAGATGVEISPPDASFSSFVQSAPPTAFIKDILEKIPDRKDGDTGTSLRDEVLSTYMRLLPETALAKSFQRRKNTEGAIEDSVYVLQSRGAALARDVANMRGNIGIDQAMVDLNEAGGKLDATDPRRVMYDELVARAKFAKNPPVDNWAKQMNRGAFIYTLGLNLSSAILNLSQVPLVVFPYLTAQYGSKRSWEEIGKAYRAVASSGFNRKIDIGLKDKDGNPRFVDAGATPSVDNFFETDGQGGYTLRQDIPIPDEMRSYLEDVEDIMRVAADRGMMHRSLLYDTLGIEEVGPKATFGDRASAFVGGPFHIAERVNRQVTLLATFRLAKEKLQAENAGMDPKRLRRKAAEQAIYQTQQMNGSNLLSTAPRYAQQGVGRVALMYKSFGIAMNYLMAKSAWNMLKNEDPATRKMAMRQLMGVHLSSLLMAGVQGMPIYGLAAMVWGLFQDDDELDPDTITRQYLGEGWWKGPLVAGSGLDFSTRIGLTDLLIRGNPYNREPSPEERLVAVFGGPAASIASRVMTGFDELGEAESGEDFYRAVEKLMPAFIANPLQVARFTAQGGIKTRRGDPVYDDIGLVELGGKLLGFAPAEYTYRQEQNLVGKRIEEAVSNERKKLYRQNYLAYMNGDFSEMRRIREDIADFNRRHPDAAITEDTLDRSIEANLRTNLERRYNGVIYNEQTKDEAMEAINGFRPGFWPFM